MTLSTVFLTADAAFALVSGGLLYFLPHIFADILFQRKSDGVHWHLVRCIGGQIAASSFVAFRFRKSSNVVKSVCHLLRIIPTIILLVLIYQCQSQTENLIPTNILKGAKILMYSSLAVNFLLLSVNKWITGSRLLESMPFGNFLYQMDALASICIGAAWITFPKWLLHRQVLVDLDESHELCGRVMGVLFISSYVVSTHALYWESQRDRKVAVDGRVVCCVAILVAQLWSQTYDAWSGNHWIGITLFSTWTVLALLYRVGLQFIKTKTK